MSTLVKHAATACVVEWGTAGELHRLAALPCNPLGATEAHGGLRWCRPALLCDLAADPTSRERSRDIHCGLARGNSARRQGGSR